MYKQILLLIVFAMFQQSIVAQDDTCDSPEDELELDLNSITKCAVEDTKDETSSLTARNSKRVTIQVSSRRRVIRKRSAVSSASSINATNKLEKIKKSTSLVGDLDLANKNVAEKLPFAFVEEKPTFSSCESAPLKQQAACFKLELQKHIKKNFKYPSKSFNKSIQGRVLIQFVINEFGNIENIITRGPFKGEELEKEARRIVEKLPKFNPGKVNGTPIKVKYGFPINFKIPGKKPSNVVKKAKANVELAEVVTFAKVESIPLFKSCNKGSDDDKLDCFNMEMTKHVQKYFAYPKEAAQNNIQGRVYAYFTIDKNGEVVNIKTKGPKGGEVLEVATKKLVEKLPKFIPGKHNGKAANVKYAFPINFRLN